MSLIFSMRVFLINLLFIVVSGIVYGQQTAGVVSYKETLQFGVKIDRYWTLHYNDETGIFLETKKGVIPDKASLEETKKQLQRANLPTEGITHKVIYIKRPPFSIVSSIKDHTLISQERFARDPVLVKEQIPKIEWVLHKEMKQISGYTCQKATTRFRGRNYTVWFTTEIPSFFGPWKLSGLPGLILEYYDDTGQAYCIATNIELRSTYDSITSVLTDEHQKGEVHDIKAYVELKKTENQVLADRIMTTLPRDAIFNVAPYVRQGYELEYEWED